MFQGQLLEIYIAERKQEPLHAVDQIEALAGFGLAGDRYCNQAGTFTKKGEPDREVTLIEIEAVEALARETDIKLTAGQARRNLITRGVPVNHLIGKEFQVGDVRLRGIRLCEPCGHLEKLTTTGIKEGLCHRGGLRAQILKGGVLRAGDVIEG